MALLEIENLRTHISSDRGVVRAVDGVSFKLEQGEVLGIVGESGSGKSVTSLSIMRLLSEKKARITADKLTFAGQEILSLPVADMGRIRTREIGMIFQDPMRSLNPVLTIGRQVSEVIMRHMHMSRRDAWSRAIGLLEKVGIPRASLRMNDYPHQFSGGMRQRVMIAIAISCNPKLLIADEATTALDVTIQAQIVELVKQLREEFGTAIIWISHDMGLVASISDKVAVMYAGRIVESGPVREVFYRPSHGYTLSLMNCSPRIDGQSSILYPIDGLPPDMTKKQTLCPFLPRCKYAVGACRNVVPTVSDAGSGHLATCHADLSVHWKEPAA